MSGNFFVPGFTNVSQRVLEIIPKNWNFSKKWKMGITPKPPDQFWKNFNSINAPYIEMFWHQNRGSSIWWSRDIKWFRARHTYVQKSAKKISFFGVFRNQGVMKRGEMQKNFFRFLDRLPYFPFYRTIVLNVKVIVNITILYFEKKYAVFFYQIKVSSRYNWKKSTIFEKNAIL